MMKLFYKGSIFVLLSISLVYTSCSKSVENSAEPEFGNIQVGVGQVNFEYDMEDLNDANSQQHAKASVGQKFSGSVQTISYDDPDGFSYTAEVIPVNHAGKALYTSSGSSGKGLKAAVPKIENLPTGIIYRLAVYKQDGTYVGHKDYKRGDASSAQYGENRKFALDGGKTYTFVCYSLMSNTAAPDLPDNPSATLAAAVINPVPRLTDSKGEFYEPTGNTDGGIDGGADFVYWKSTILVKDDMNLAINLKHMFVGIDLSIIAPTGAKLWLQNVSDKVTNKIDSISRARPFANRMTTKLFDGSFVNPYALSVNLKGKTLFFDNQNGVSSLKINPFVFYMGTNSTTVGELQVNNVSMLRSNGLSKKNMLISNLSLKARTKYKINITIK